MVWKPHVTVAAIVEREGRFLLVEEETSTGIAFNQPAGHLENNESLLQAVAREVREETAWGFEAESLVAVQLWRKTPEYPSFLRFCFSGQVSDFDSSQALDEGIIRTHWLSREEIAGLNNLRSPLVLIGIDEYLKGQHYPLSMLQTFLDKP